MKEQYNLIIGRMLTREFHTKTLERSYLIEINIAAVPGQPLRNQYHRNGPPKEHCIHISIGKI